jgi:putative lipoprotein
MQPSDLIDSQWIPTELNGQPALQFAGSPGLELCFSRTHQVDGFGGCNRFFGSYECDGDALTLGPLGSTRRFGPAELMKQESTLLAALQRVTAYRLSGDNLLLLSGEQVVLRCRLGGPPEA